jgi:hypothetical protein
VQFVQLLLTDEQALYLNASVDLLLADTERFVMTDEERDNYQRLSVFFSEVVRNPAHFAPTGEMADTVKSIVRKLKGPAQPQSRRNRRKARQERRMSFRKRERAQRRENAEMYNAAMAALEAERVEAEAAWQEIAERYANEPKVMVLTADGVPVMTDIPASMVVPMPTPEEIAAENHRIEQATAEYFHGDEGRETPKIILPGTAEALGLTEV